MKLYVIFWEKKFCLHSAPSPRQSYQIVGKVANLSPKRAKYLQKDGALLVKNAQICDLQT